MSFSFRTFDARVIETAQKLFLPFARFAIFVVYFWFGVIKIPNLSPANPLIAELLEKTLPFVTFEQFIVFFGILEVIIGILFLIPRLERVAIILLLLHMITTVMPMVLLPAISWDAPFLPTLEGQYMIKNIVTLALVIGIWAQLKPLSSSNPQ